MQKSDRIRKAGSNGGQRALAFSAQREGSQTLNLCECASFLTMYVIYVNIVFRIEYLWSFFLIRCYVNGLNCNKI